MKDNQTGKVIAQLKMRNISQKPIKAAKVSIHPLDTVGNPLGEKIEYQYLDLSAARDEDFGQKVPVALPDAATRAFTASVEEIVFADNSIWTATGEPWEVLDTPGSLSSIGDAELIKQFRLKYGNNCKNLPLLHKDLWYCACGELNRQGEAECHSCQKSFALLKQIDMDELRKERDIRVAAEKEQAEKEAAAAKAHAKKMGRIAAIVVPILVVLIVAAVIISNSAKKSNAYENALALLDAGQYTEAIEAFTSLGNYKDCPNQIRAAKYESAFALLNAGNYDEAIDIFTELGEYEDCAEQIEVAANAKIEAERIAELETQYNHAIELLSQGSNESDNEAYLLFVELGDYKDAASYVEDFQYLLIKSQRIGSDWERHYSYDDHGRIISQTGGGSYNYSYVYYADGSYSINNGYGTDTFNANGDAVKLGMSNGSEYTCIWEYYEDGSRKSMKAYYENELIRSYEYDENGYRTYWHKDGITYVQKVDEHDNVIDENNGQYKYVYVYDQDKVLSYEAYSNGKLFAYDYYTYDEYGSLIKHEGLQARKTEGFCYEYLCTYAYLYCPNAE